MGITLAALEEHLKKSGAGWILTLCSLMDELDLRRLRTPLPAGRPPYDPRALLGLVFYGLFCGVRSLRGLERLARLDAGAWYLTGGAFPEHSCIGKFLLSSDKKLSDTFFVESTRHFVVRLKEAHKGDFHPGPCALDASVVGAAASRHRTVSLPEAQKERTQLEEKLRENFDPRAQQRWESLQQGIESLIPRVEACRKQGKDVSAVSVALSDPVAVVQPDKTGRSCPSYRPCILVEQHRLIVGQDVDPASEQATVSKPAADFQQIYGQKVPLMLADTNYCNFESLQRMGAASDEVLSPPKSPPRKLFKLPMFNGHFDKTAFFFDEKSGTLTCPQGRPMKRIGTTRSVGQRMTTFLGDRCDTCPVRKQCTSSDKGRSVKWYEVDAAKEQMRRKLREPDKKAAFSLRKQTVELVWARLKGWLQLGRFARRGLERVRMEFALFCLAHNVFFTVLQLEETA